MVHARDDLPGRMEFDFYHDKAKTDQGFKEYLNEFVYSVKDHEEYLLKIGDKRLSEIKADPILGYRADLKGRY
jgi:glutaconate CoA-transferase subunit A